MKKTYLVLTALIATTFLLTSCGPSEADLQKVLDDVEAWDEEEEEEDPAIYSSEDRSFPVLEDEDLLINEVNYGDFVGGNWLDCLKNRNPTSVSIKSIKNEKISFSAYLTRIGNFDVKNVSLKKGKANFSAKLDADEEEIEGYIVLGPALVKLVITQGNSSFEEDLRATYKLPVHLSNEELEWFGKAVPYSSGFWMGGWREIELPDWYTDQYKKQQSD